MPKSYICRIYISFSCESAQTQKQLAEKLGITQQAISEKLRALGKIQKHGRWVTHELTQEQHEKRVDTCLSLLSRQKID